MANSQGTRAGQAIKTGQNSWIDQELDESVFQDARLGRRLRALLARFAQAPGQSIPWVCQDWANTKAAYRFLSNERVNEADILAGHFSATRQRIVAASQAPVLVLHDTTEFAYHRDSDHALGLLGKVNSGWDSQGRVRHHTVRGLLMHSSLAVTTEGLPLGLAAVKFWSRSKFKGTNALKRSINPTRVPIELKESMCWLDNVRLSGEMFEQPERCVHIGDRGSDIYELFCQAHEAQTHFIFRTCADRLAGDGTHTVATYLREVRCRGLHRIQVRNSQGQERCALLELKYCRVRLLPPRAKQSRYPPLMLTVLQAVEREAPLHADPIDWKLITNLPVTSRAQAIEKLDWYAMRWKIETYHKILKSGCRAEDSKLRTAQRLTNLIAMFCLLGWRIFWLTMMNRAAPEAPPRMAFTEAEVEVLDRLRPPSCTAASPCRQSLSSCLMQLARLGGYLARASDPPPGNTVI
ncbi:IS4 family transposase [Eleftheria terrae]|uniref:IS4 family transposase n=1 Tax=Eleftheria terrae TaxID=1597781 RepID=UPI00263BDCF9|nr:IS4 family transposase [Eleftheria terrae]WKB56009.1 IS4 family transposase [Eleftheria terrae]